MTSPPAAAAVPSCCGQASGNVSTCSLRTTRNWRARPDGGWNSLAGRRRWDQAGGAALAFRIWRWRRQRQRRSVLSPGTYLVLHYKPSDAADAEAICEAVHRTRRCLRDGEGGSAGAPEGTRWAMGTAASASAASGQRSPLRSVGISLCYWVRVAVASFARTFWLPCPGGYDLNLIFRGRRQSKTGIILPFTGK
jgi:hypothetical protein